MFTYIFLYLYIYIFLIIEYISPALKLGINTDYFYTLRSRWLVHLDSKYFFSFTYAELKERIMPKSYYRRCKNSSFVNGYNEMRIRKRQVHSWPFLTGKLIYWPAKRREHVHVWHTKETDHPGETQAEITRPSSIGSTEIKLHFSSLFLPYNNFLLNFYLITYV